MKTGKQRKAVTDCRCPFPQVPRADPSEMRDVILNFVKMGFINVAAKVHYI